MHQNPITDLPFLEAKLMRMSWERSYLEALIDRLRPSGTVLEVGFALGYSSIRIQSFNPTHHTIIEADPAIASNANRWASQYDNVSVIQGKWKDVLPTMGVFDAIFFNDFTPDCAPEKSREIANLTVQKGRDLISNIKKSFPQITAIKYSDVDLDEFFNCVGRFDILQMSSFLHELFKNGQISESQFDAAITKYNLEKLASCSTTPEPKVDLSLAFLKTCLKNHMRKGSRFSCFSGSPVSRFENPDFFDSIITDPSYDYQEVLIPVDVPEYCNYYKHKEALIMTLEKQI